MLKLDYWNWKRLTVKRTNLFISVKKRFYDEKQVIVIGGGASGMMAAITARRWVRKSPYWSVMPESQKAAGNR
jgi:thioredoxin reductase